MAGPLARAASKSLHPDESSTYELSVSGSASFCSQSSLTRSRTLLLALSSSTSNSSWSRRLISLKLKPSFNPCQIRSPVGFRL